MLFNRMLKKKIEGSYIEIVEVMTQSECFSEVPGLLERLWDNGSEPEFEQRIEKMQ